MNRYVVALVAVMSLGTVTACGEGLEGGADGELRVGVILPLTGPAAPFGVPARAAIEQRVDEINEGGGVDGRDIELIIEDDATDPTTAAEKASELVGQGVVAVIGSATSSASLALVPITAQAEVPTLAIAGAPVVTDPDEEFHEYTWRVAPNDADAVPLILDYLKENGAARVAVFAQDDAYGELGTEQIEELTQDDPDLEVVGVATAALTATDVQAQATRIQSFEPDAILLQVSSVGLASSFLRSVEDLGIDANIVGGTGLGQRALIEAAGPASEGVTVLNYLDPSNLTPEQDEFFKAMQASGYDPAYSFSEIVGAAAVDILVAAMEEAGSTVDAQSINEAFNAGVEADSISLAPVRLSEDEHDFFTDESLVWTTVTDGEFVAAE